MVARRGGTYGRNAGTARKVGVRGAVTASGWPAKACPVCEAAPGQPCQRRTATLRGVPDSGWWVSYRSVSSGRKAHPDRWSDG